MPTVCSECNCPIQDFAYHLLNGLFICSECNKIETENHDNEIEWVNSPDHYKSESGLEAVDVIEAFNLGYNLGNAFAYIARCRKKGEFIQDLEKAIWHIKREIEKTQ